MFGMVCYAALVTIRGGSRTGEQGIHSWLRPRRVVWPRWLGDRVGALGGK